MRSETADNLLAIADTIITFDRMQGYVAMIAVRSSDLGLESKRSGLKLQRLRQMLGKIGPIVSSGINMKFMRDVTRRQSLIQRLGAGVKSEVILRAAVEINLQPGKFRGPRDFQRI